MKPFPNSDAEFQQWFSTEEQCRDYLAWLRWGQDLERFDCPRCHWELPRRRPGDLSKRSRAWRCSRRGLFVCRNCEYQVSVTAGTMIDRMRIPLKTWLQILWWLDHTRGTAYALKRRFSLGSYTTAHALIRHIRDIMGDVEEVKMAGLIKIQRICPGVEADLPSIAPWQDHHLWFLVQQSDTIGDIKVIWSPQRKPLDQEVIIERFVQPNSSIQLAGAPREGLIDINGKSYIVVSSQTSAMPPAILESVRKAYLRLHRWIEQVASKSLPMKTPQQCLNEFMFHHNKPQNRPGRRFYLLARQAMTEKPVREDL